ncbi:hypothetical protein Tco_1515857 [Tanacetum coccineum]
MRPVRCPDTILNTLDHQDDKVADDVENKTIEDPAKEDEKYDQDLREFKRLIVQGKEAKININSTNSVSVVSSPVNTVVTKDADVNSTNSIYTASPLVNFDGLSYFNANPPDDPKMPNLEDTGIFGGAYDDEDFVAGGDMNNLESSMPVSPIATTRVHKDHPVEQIIRDLHLAPQIRRMTKNSEEHVEILIVCKSTDIWFREQQAYGNLVQYSYCMFWSTAKIKTVNNKTQIRAKVDGKTIVITESSVRRDLHFDDEDDEAVHEERGDSVERAATTATSLDAEQSSGASPRRQDTILGDRPAQTRFKRIESSAEKSLGDQEDASKHGRNEIDQDEGISCVPSDMDVSAVSPIRPVYDSIIDDITLAKTLMKIKSSASRSQKDKGVMFKEPSEPTTTSRPQPHIPAKDKGKGIMQEPEKPVKLDEEARLEREREEEASIAALIEEWDSIEATIDDDRELAKQLQAQEKEELTVEEQSKLLAKFIETRRKYIAAKRVEEYRNKPPTKTQQRSLMCTYLKNMEGYKHKDFKGKSFDAIKKLFEKAYKRVNTFVVMDSKVVESSGKKAESNGKEAVSKKRAGEKLSEESIKRQKLEGDAKKADLKLCLEIAPNDDKAINIKPLAIKSPITRFDRSVQVGGLVACNRRLIGLVDLVLTKPEGVLALWILLSDSVTHCAVCGTPVDGPYCHGCTLIRTKFEKDLFAYCVDNGVFQNLQDTPETSNDNTNVVNTPREPSVVDQDPGVNISQDPPQIDHNCCYECGDSLNGIFCQKCICEFCGKGAHFGYNCPPKDPIISEPEPCYNQNFDCFPHDLQTLPQQYLCCENCGGPHETYQCQPMNQEYFYSHSSGFDQFQPPQFSDAYQIPPVASMENATCSN